MFSYISADQRVPTDHPLRPVRSMADEALRAALPTISEAVRVNRTTSPVQPGHWRDFRHQQPGSGRGQYLQRVLELPVRMFAFEPWGMRHPRDHMRPSIGTMPPSRLIPGARSYDGLELRITKTSSQRWFAMFSYTYSRLRGNYTGLTATDIADGGGGRNAPNNSRSFDEPYFSFNANGGSSSGLLPTDRPNAFKGYAYYEMPWGNISNKLGTDFGIYQFAYSGSPLTSYLDVGFSSPGAWPVDIVGRGKWVDVTEDPTTGAVTAGTPRTNCTPWFTQTDFNIQQKYKLREEMAISFSVTFTNLLNQRAVTSVGQQIDSNITQSFITPVNTFIASNGFYANAERPYDVQSLLNQANFWWSWIRQHYLQPIRKALSVSDRSHHPAWGEVHLLGT
jgi:hypothetical protein